MTQPQPQPQSRFRRFWKEWLKPILVAVIAVTTFRSSLADWNDVPSGSMQPTILEGDRVFLDKRAYDLRVPFLGWRIFAVSDPQRGDIVIFPSPVDGVRLIKRIVGVPGDSLETRGRKLFVNGEPVGYAEPDAAELEGVDRDVLAGKRALSERLPGRTHAVLLARGGRIAHDFGPVVLKDGEYFAMGDNRDDSLDSRSFGPVRRDAIEGKALAVAVSVDPDRWYLPRFDRFFSPLR